MSKSGQEAGGKFNGPSIKFIINEYRLLELSELLPIEAESTINYMRSLRELHRVTVHTQFDSVALEKALFNF